MLIRFVHAGGSVNFTRNPVQPDEKEDKLLQPSEESTGDEIFGFDYAAKEKYHTLYWPRQPKVDFDAHYNFFHNIAKGMSELFTYYDKAGSAISARFASPTFEWAEVAYEQYRVKVILMEG